MTAVRSLVFNLLFYVNLIVQMLFWAPLFFLGSERTAWWIVKSWARSCLWLLEVVAGTGARITGQSEIPAGPVIIAAKHQSFWEIFALLPELDKPTFIMKRELMQIPVFGHYARRMKMIPVDRKRRGATLPALVAEAAKAVAEGRQIVIFPEGTRTAPGADTEYRPGIHRLYAELGIPVVPVALNSGLFWPRRRFLRRPGTIRAEFLPAIEPGLEREDFLARLKDEIEGRSNALLRDAFAERSDLPRSAAIEARLREPAE